MLIKMSWLLTFRGLFVHLVITFVCHIYIMLFFFTHAHLVSGHASTCRPPKYVPPENMFAYSYKNCIYIIGCRGVDVILLQKFDIGSVR